MSKSVNKGLMGLALVGVCALQWYAFVWEPAEHAPASAHVSAEGEEELAPNEDHWSIVSQFAPGLVHNVQGAMGHQFLFGDPVTQVAHVFMSFVVFFGVLFLVVRSRKKFSDPDSAVVPDDKLTAATFFELMVGGVYSMMSSMMGEKKARDCFPLVGALAIFILFGNLLGLIPGFLPVTDSLSTTVTLGILVFIMTHYYGVKYNGMTYFKHFLGPIVKWYALPLMVLMCGIEIVSHIARPISLGLRLLGNMFGDHKVLSIFLSFQVLFVPIPLLLLGILVCVVQAFVFCLLTMVYFSLAVEDMAHH